jgi:hypothetical protein
VSCRHGKQGTDMAPPMQELHQIAQWLLSNLLRICVLPQRLCADGMLTWQRSCANRALDMQETILRC